jgi:hypothetical protein
LTKISINEVDAELNSKVISIPRPKNFPLFESLTTIEFRGTHIWKEGHAYGHAFESPYNEIIQGLLKVAPNLNHFLIDVYSPFFPELGTCPNIIVLDWDNIFFPGTSFTTDVDYLDYKFGVVVDHGKIV